MRTSVRQDGKSFVPFVFLRGSRWSCRKLSAALVETAHEALFFVSISVLFSMNSFIATRTNASVHLVFYRWHRNGRHRSVVTFSRGLLLAFRHASEPTGLRGPSTGARLRADAAVPHRAVPANPARAQVLLGPCSHAGVYRLCCSSSMSRGDECVLLVLFVWSSCFGEVRG